MFSHTKLQKSFKLTIFLLISTCDLLYKLGPSLGVTKRKRKQDVLQNKRPNNLHKACRDFFLMHFIQKSKKKVI